MRYGHSFRGLVITVLAALPIAVVYARPISVDFPTGGEFANEGASWEFPSAFLSPSELPATGSLEFSFETFSGSALNVGGTSFTGFCMFEDGAFALTSGGCGDAGNATFNMVAGLDLVASGSATDPFVPGAVFISHGYSADRLVAGEPGAAGPYDLADARTALRFSWIDMAAVSAPDDPAYSLQAFIYFLGDGNFELDLRYGGTSFAGASQSFTQGGTSLFSNDSPLVAGNNYFFRFIDGALVGGGGGPPPNGVPEPGSLALFLVGLAGLAWATRRRTRPIG